MVTKTALNKSQAMALVKDLFKDFQNWISQKNDPTLSELEKKFTHDFHLSSNGLLECKNLSDHMNRLAKLRKKFSRIETEGPFEEPFVCDNKLTVYYALNLTGHNGQKSQVVIMAIGTVEDNKFQNWIQVAHERGRDWSHL